MEEKLLEKIDEISDQMIEGIKRIIRIDSVEDTPFLRYSPVMVVPSYISTEKSGIISPTLISSFVTGPS